MPPVNTALARVWRCSRHFSSSATHRATKLRKPTQPAPTAQTNPKLPPAPSRPENVPDATPSIAAVAEERRPRRAAWLVPPEPQSILERPRGTIVWTGLVVTGVAFFGLLGFYGTTLYNYSKLPPTHEDAAQAEIDLTAVYDDTADHFDEDVESIEYWTGLMRLRRRLVKQARGHVLESAAGTGRNSEFYVRDRVKSLVLVDRSRAMLRKAEEKWQQDRDGEDWTGRVHFLVGDVEDGGDVEADGGDVEDGERGRLRPIVDGKAREEKFDTIVQTLGLCSTNNPDGLMRRLAGLVKPGGTILLLEHGRGYFDWLNIMLDRSARSHAETHGCWWNRDIGAIVEKSGLEVVQLKRQKYSAGTNWYIILRKPSVIQP